MLGRVFAYITIVAINAGDCYSISHFS